MSTETYTNIVLGSSESTDIKGYYFYKLLKTQSEYYNNFKTVDDFSEQRIERKFDITTTFLDSFSEEFELGCIPNVLSTTASGFDIIVRKNGDLFTDFTYTSNDDKEFCSR